MLESPVFRASHFVFAFGARGELKSHRPLRGCLSLQLEDGDVDSVGRVLGKECEAHQIPPPNPDDVGSDLAIHGNNRDLVETVGHGRGRRRFASGGRRASQREPGGQAKGAQQGKRYSFHEKSSVPKLSNPWAQYEAAPGLCKRLTKSRLPVWNAPALSRALWENCPYPAASASFLDA